MDGPQPNQHSFSYLVRAYSYSIIIVCLANVDPRFAPKKKLQKEAQLSTFGACNRKTFVAQWHDTGVLPPAPVQRPAAAAAAAATPPRPSVV